MQNSDVFWASNSLEVLESKINEEGNYRGYRSELAKAAGCQPAYLSQVLAGKVSLTADQASGLSEFWGMDEFQADAFLTLVELDRAASERLKRKLKARLKRLQKNSTSKSEKHTTGFSLSMSDSQALSYYSSWTPSAVHMLLNFKGGLPFSEILQRLSVDADVLKSVLLDLMKANLVEKQGEKYLSKAKFAHVKDEHTFAALHHTNWREKAKSYYSHGLIRDNFHYTSVCSLDKKAFQQVRKVLEEAKQRAEETIKNAPENTIGCLNLDWFEI